MLNYLSPKTVAVAIIGAVVAGLTTLTEGLDVSVFDWAGRWDITLYTAVLTVLVGIGAYLKQDWDRVGDLVNYFSPKMVVPVITGIVITAIGAAAATINVGMFDWAGRWDTVLFTVVGLIATTLGSYQVDDPDRVDFDNAYIEDEADGSEIDASEHPGEEVN